MKLVPGTPLRIELMLDERQPEPVGRLAATGGLAQLEWAAPVIEQRRRIDLCFILPKPGFMPRAGAASTGCTAFSATACPMPGGGC